MMLLWVQKKPTMLLGLLYSYKKILWLLEGLLPGRSFPVSLFFVFVLSNDYIFAVANRKYIY